ncbi:MAG: GAF domain-containing protein [Alphaproteobacteria bacterium]|nr:GAF domain-containing protein [Alphaproteobacteria bacterium]
MTDRLTIADLAELYEKAAGAADARALYRAVDEMVQRRIGHRLFTIMRIYEGGQEVERVYSSNEKAYSVGGRKVKQGTHWGDKVLGRGEVHIARDKDEVKRAFADYELIWSLGVESIMNMPVSFRGRQLGTMNVSGTAHQFGEADVRAARAIAAYLVPVLLADY